MSLGISVSIAAISAFATVLIYHFAFILPRMREIRRSSMSIRAQTAIELPPQNVSFDAYAERTENRIAELERVARRDVYRAGFVRYNSFRDVGSELSYALALINGEGDGVVLTSIYSREETRTFGKSVRRFSPQQDASKEETTAIALARTGTGP